MFALAHLQSTKVALQSTLSGTSGLLIENISYASLELLSENTLRVTHLWNFVTLGSSEHFTAPQRA
jgi:hypothetical protein